MRINRLLSTTGSFRGFAGMDTQQRDANSENVHHRICASWYLAQRQVARKKYCRGGCCTPHTHSLNPPRFCTWRSTLARLSCKWGIYVIAPMHAAPLRQKIEPRPTFATDSSPLPDAPSKQTSLPQYSVPAFALLPSIHSAPVDCPGIF